MHLRPVKRTPVPYILSALVAALAVTGMFVTFVGTQVEISGLGNDLESLEKEFEDYEDVQQEFDDLQNRKRLLATKKETIVEITRDRMVWSKQLWNLSRLIPSNAWYEEITIVPRRFPETVQVFNKQTEQLESKEVMVERQVLVVSGYVVETKDGLAEISPLTTALASDPEFSDKFVMQLPAFRDDEFEGYPVRRFSLEFMIGARATSTGSGS
jgi:hypothetical protein